MREQLLLDGRQLPNGRRALRGKDLLLAAGVRLVTERQADREGRFFLSITVFVVGGRKP